jgi:lipopolysaccharide export LptBFGC system permease protein LptF
MLAALVIYAVYYNMLDVGRTWVELGTRASIWWVPGMLALLVAVLYLPWQKARQKLLDSQGSGT